MTNPLNLAGSGGWIRTIDLRVMSPKEAIYPYFSGLTKTP